MPLESRKVTFVQIDDEDLDAVGQGGTDCFA